jgi:hypothetical protein
MPRLSLRIRFGHLPCGVGVFSPWSTTNSVITRSADFLSQADTSVSALQPMLALLLFDLLARGGTEEFHRACTHAGSLNRLRTPKYNLEPWMAYPTVNRFI